MAYNFKKKTCDICGVREEKVKFDFLRKQESFLLGYNGEVWCAKCHKEKELKDLFKLMDIRDAKRKIDNKP